MDENSIERHSEVCRDSNLLQILDERICLEQFTRKGWFQGIFTVIYCVDSAGRDYEEKRE